MDLSFPLHRPFDRSLEPWGDGATELAVLPHDLAVLMVGVAARQAASATAAAQVADGAYHVTDDTLFRPVCGAFNGAVAVAIVRWRVE